jgi:hypothetical protein
LRCRSKKARQRFQASSAASFYCVRPMEAETLAISGWALPNMRPSREKSSGVIA